MTSKKAVLLKIEPGRCVVEWETGGFGLGVLGATLTIRTRFLATEKTNEPNVAGEW
jgi:hypothetical protein